MMPWEYNNEILPTYCESCHLEIHGEVQIHFLNRNAFFQTYLSKCLNSSGTEYLPQYHYYIDGTCFDCNGSGFKELKPQHPKEQNITAAPI